MNPKDLHNQIALGEDSTRQFKKDIRNAESMASEMAAFANSEGGTIFIGVTDDGEIIGLDRSDVSRVNQLISNAASQLVKSPLTVRTENILLRNGRIVIMLTVPKGIDKPFFDNKGVIWLKTGSDKRRVNSREELRRLFQVSEQFHGDELPVRAGVEAIDRLRFRDFLQSVYNQQYPENPDDLLRLLQNMNLATEQGKLNLAGLLLFGERPESLKPQFVVKAIRFPGNRIHAKEYIDTEDFSGPLPEIFKGAMAFVMRNLHKIQNGRGVNSPGQPEIPEAVFEELLTNALMHRDYLVSAPVRLFIFDDRVEIISPGHLPNNLTVEKIRAGNSNIRNPVLVSYAAKGLLPYHGLGSGITRALMQWPDIDFTDDHDGDLFTATVFRKEIRRGAEPDRGQAGTKAGPRRDQVGTKSAPSKHKVTTTRQAPDKRPAGTKLAPSRHQVGTKLGPSRDQTGTKSELCQIQIDILKNCAEPQSMADLQSLFDRNNRTKFRNQFIKPLIEKGLLEMTIPEKPTSSRQRYRLTARGKKVRGEVA